MKIGCRNIARKDFLRKDTFFSRKDNARDVFLKEGQRMERFSQGRTTEGTFFSRKDNARNVFLKEGKRKERFSQGRITQGTFFSRKDIARKVFLKEGKRKETIPKKGMVMRGIVHKESIV